MAKDQRFVLLHGFDREELGTAMRSLRQAFPDKDLVFAVTTPTSLTWKVGDLISEVLAEHEQMKHMQKKGGDAE